MAAEEEPFMSETVTMKQLLEAGVHFGHQSRRWNPKMAKYIFTERNGIYIIDLKKTLRLLREGMKFVKEGVAQGKKVLFVGTKKQARDSIEQAAKSCGMFYVNNRWLGGMLTNFKTIRRSIMRLIDLEKMETDGTLKRYTKKEISRFQHEKDSLAKNLAGVKNMSEIPGIVFIVDPHKESIAVHEANKLKIPIVAIVDTNCDPDVINYVIPGNDDAIRAIKLMADQVKFACIEGLMEMQAIQGVDPAGLTPEIAAVLGIPLPTPAAQPAPAPTAQPAPIAAPQPVMETPAAPAPMVEVPPAPTAQPAPVAAPQPVMETPTAPAPMVEIPPAPAPMVEGPPAVSATAQPEPMPPAPEPSTPPVETPVGEPISTPEQV
jgi:small subunit ribosomal protein S2